VEKSKARVAKALALAGFADTGPGHLNCAQAVIRFASLLLGEGEDTVVLARYFGGGMTRMGEVCGALSGAALSLGLRDRCRGLEWPDGQSPDTEKLQQLFRRFDAEFGATTCRQLVGYLTDTAQGHDRFRDEDKYTSCRSYVSWVCDQLQDLLTTSGDGEP
jgi:C_GCAxxG_C_C family probable redox protein